MTLPIQQRKINLKEMKVFIRQTVFCVNGITIEGYIARCRKTIVYMYREHAYNVAWSLGYSFDSYTYLQLTNNITVMKCMLFWFPSKAHISLDRL